MAWRGTLSILIGSTSLQTQYYFGLPRNVKADGLMMDADRSSSLLVDKQNNADAFRNYMRASGARQSAMERLVPEQMFSTADNPAHGVSAVKAIQIAAARGQRIYTITQANVNSSLSSVTLPTEVKTTIRNAVAAGKEVTTHEAPIEFYGSPQVGYTVIDPQTGAGGYHIYGGESGSRTIDIALGTWGYITSLMEFGTLLMEKLAPALRVLGWAERAGAVGLIISMLSVFNSAAQ